MAITSDEIIKLDNGAKFYRADLHIHTYGASKCVKDSGMTPEAILNTADNLGISILAITDHNNYANLDRAIDCSQKYVGKILLLPGVEINTAHGHLLVLFPPTKAIAVGQLLGRIKLTGDPGSEDCHTTMSMADVLSEARSLGGVCIAAHIDREKTGFETLAKGFPSWKRDILTSEGLYALEIDEAPNLVWYSDEDEGNDDANERRKLIRAREITVPGRMGIARIQGSDAHSLVDFEQCSKQEGLTRFKMNELSFEAFKTALVDSAARVRATATVPRSIPRIVGMSLTGGFLNAQRYHLNNNLNCFIGGRGTGKSTALKSLAYALGEKDDFAAQDNCPDNIVVYCENADGTLFRYVRDRDGEISVKARHNKEITDVPVDIFPIEYYGQGDLAEVAKDPLKNPILLQQFLDRHIQMDDLLSEEQDLIMSLNENSSSVIPLYTTVSQLKLKRDRLKEIGKKLEIAEEGKLKELVKMQLGLATERRILERLSEARDFFLSGISFDNFIRNFSLLITDEEGKDTRKEIKNTLEEIKNIIEHSNQYFTDVKRSITEKMKSVANEFEPRITSIRALVEVKDQEIQGKLDEFRVKGLSGDIREIDKLIGEKKALEIEIEKLEQKQSRLKELNAEREELKIRIVDIRERMTARRKAQFIPINRSLAALIQEYTVVLRYEPSGVVDEFKELLLDAMQGSYFSDESARQLCLKITPQRLATLAIENNNAAVSKEGEVSDDWGSQIVTRLWKKGWKAIHDLEVMWKRPRPVIYVRKKSGTKNMIPVTQLSDGQKHTILLTIAMLSESNCPLLIDQPEDDLDNAFIFDCVVSTLRKIKEKRQVILVTHNANIAVLGDAELLLPMKRDGDTGMAFDCGSVDRPETKVAVQRILEGGEMAFKRRKEIYGV